MEHNNGIFNPKIKKIVKNVDEKNHLWYKTFKIMSGIVGTGVVLHKTGEWLEPYEKEFWERKRLNSLRFGEAIDRKKEQWIHQMSKV